MFVLTVALMSDLLMPAWAAPASDPVADPAAVVVEGPVRFTVLTSRLVRMEWAADGRFEDHASLVFLNRRLPVPKFSVHAEGEWLVLQTEGLSARYKKGSGKFSADNLEVRCNFNQAPVVWHPGMEDRGNLKGTIRTLDGVRGETPLEPGLLSRDGWVVVDDSERSLFDESDWPWVVTRASGDRQDLYFFGYGHEYRKQLKDFTLVAGKIPLPPRFAFGTWWSRYWAYTDEEFKDLVNEFRDHDVPLDVLVIDMDWHLTFNMRWEKEVLDQAGQRLGWTGYTWDKNFFPDPSGFLRWCEKKGLRTPLNLHPASGIQPHEDHYPDMARAMGMDPSAKKYVPFDIVDKKFAVNYMNTIIRPLEQQGVDFWWLDWQAWGMTKIPGVTPTWWLNYVFFTDMERRNRERPILFHRWGGLGNHRYQIGFSGDVVSVWESLAFQPYFTATASNVGFGYWSHDIGGHMPGEVSPELYTRWIQFGVFSPILRTHTTKNPLSERRMWAYPDEYFRMMRDAFQLRYALIPYIYTTARASYDAGVSVCHPMYYDYPELKEAYEFKDQYMFGDALLVAPIAEPVSETSLLVSKKIWLPEGEWVEWYTGTRLKGPAIVERYFAVDEIPVFARAGTILPMQPKMLNTGERPVDPLILTIFPGDSGSTRVYEDEGNSPGYTSNECSWTPVRHSTVKGEKKIEILPAEGRYPGMPATRSYEVRLEGTLPPAAVIIGAEKLPFVKDSTGTGWSYIGDRLTTVIRLPSRSVKEKIELTVSWDGMKQNNDAVTQGVRGELSRLRRVMAILNTQWPKEWSPEILIAAVQTGNRMGIQPGRALLELQDLDVKFGRVKAEIQTLKIPEEMRKRVLSHLTLGMKGE